MCVCVSEKNFTVSSLLLKIEINALPSVRVPVHAFPPNEAIDASYSKQTANIYLFNKLLHFKRSNRMRRVRVHLVISLFLNIFSTHAS